MRAATDIRLALVGCGAAARRYYVPALQTLSRLGDRLYLVDNNVERASRLAAELGTPHYADTHEAILDKVQGVIVATPHFLHYPVALDCLKHGIHVLCEKPLAETPGQVLGLIAEADRRGVTISVNNTRRLFPSFRQVHQWVSRGDLGNVHSIHILEAQKFDWESATGFYVNPWISAKGVVLDLGSHVFDLVCWWLGGKPDLISYEDDSFGGPESLARLRGRRGVCHIDITLNRLVDLEPRYVITGEKGTLECHPDDWKMLTRISPAGRVQATRIATTPRTYPGFVTRLVHNFIGIIAHNERPLVPASEVLPSIELIDECYRRRARFSMPWYQDLEALLR